MSTETQIKRKKGSDKNKLQSGPEGDHRKRSRNRCIRSCINCHASKRMCDRKRPACARCTQLGLVSSINKVYRSWMILYFQTGLCVYEVDDPNQRSNTQDESSRLLERVAELEGVIRELKNKPRPRWMPSACSEHSDDASHVAYSSSPSPTAPHLQGESSSQAPSVEESCAPQAPALLTSPSSSPSSAVTPPTENSSSPHPTINEDPTGLMGLDMFVHSPSFIGYSDDRMDTVHQQLVGVGITKSPYPIAQTCNCVLEATNYQTMLELSLRLRKAASILARSSHHQTGVHCLLNQRLSELDVLTTNTLSSVDSPHLSYGVHQGIHPSTVLTSTVPSPFYNPANTAASRLDTWLEGAITEANNIHAVNDSFMSWDPPRRAH
ncbi:hypothetical protein J3R30DRAFT_1768225 [Lentinula aciculospora]|uniref:Zn(2)-C6 fungal-type domain-containing protein n=1 Tax=Lentinula aciculospora TaxID=153920 RepID=A0A9W9DSF3_9AGAR|nr:hypothetical protein J3R30DRAFT_1768225 [Lentinula aciculospora]